MDSQNKQDPNVVCSTAAPLCDAGYSGKCMAVPEANTKAISSGPSERSSTLQQAGWLDECCGM